MKKTITIIVLSFVCFSVFGQPVIPDTIYNIQWELLDEPSGQATGFAKSGNRLFAAPHFYSDDMGENWQRIIGYVDMEGIVASDEVVFLRDSRRFDVYRGPGGTKRYKTFSSSDGSAFILNRNDVVSTGGHGGVYPDVSPILKKNDSVFFFSKYAWYPFEPISSSVGQLHFTNDAGITWDFISFFAEDRISVAEDTVLAYNYLSGEALILGNDDFSLPIRDTLSKDLPESLIYAKGTYYYLSEDKRFINFSNDHGRTWEMEEVPNYSPDLPKGNLKYFDNSIYLSDYRHVYQMSPENLLNFNVVYTSLFQNKSSLMLAEFFDGIWLINDLDGIHRSLDNGITWERKTKGLTNFGKAVYGRDPNPFLLAGDRFYLGSGDSINRSSISGDTWEVLNDSFFAEHTLIGYAKGSLFASRNSDRQILRSTDSGFNWNEVPNIRGEKVYDTSDKIFIGQYYSEDQGLTWTNFDSPYQVSAAFQDTFLAFDNRYPTGDMRRHYSYDKGLTWQSNDYSNFQMNKVGEVGDTLISFYDNRVSYSPNKGRSWIKTQEIEPLSCFGTNSFNCTDAVFNGYANGLLIANSGRALHVSKNLGDTWKVVKDVPFGDSIPTNIYQVEGYLEAGGIFEYKDGYLYVFKLGQGVWRTPFDPIDRELPTTISERGEITGRVYIDMDNDCTYNPTVDEPLVNQSVKISDFYVDTDHEGKYHSFLEFKDYEVTTRKPDFHENLCISSDTVSIQVDNRALQTVDFAFSLIPELGEISGRVYLDRDKDCNYNSTIDKPLTNQVVKISNLYAVTNHEGEYHSLLEFKDYEVTTRKPNFHENLCNSGDTVSIQVDSRTLQTVDFAFSLIPDIYDLKISLTSGRLRPGFESSFRINVKNIGTEPVMGAPVNFNFDPAKYQIIDAGTGTVIGGTIYFSTDLAIGEQVTFYGTLRLLPSIPLGTKDTISAIIDLPIDIDFSNNKASLVRTVRGSYDPNDKTAIPRDHIFPLTENEIEYLIRFQNTGTDTAFTVRLVDTISSQFNLLTLEMIDASHDYELTIEENRELVWLFEDILLVDSFTNEPLSHGYIHFSIKTDSTVADMDTLKNEAAIYFDFNDPIITNETENEVRKGLYEELNSYEICKGELLNGQFHYVSTFISDTIVGMFWDSIFNTEIVVHPIYSIWKDLNLSPGDTFQNTVITSDTLIVENHLTAFGCDSTVMTNILLLSSTNQIENHSLLLKAYPNPFTKDLTLEVTSENYGPANLEVINNIGQIIFRKEVNLIVGKNKIPIEMKGSDIGLLTIKLSQQSNGIKAQIKVARMRE